MARGVARADEFSFGAARACGFARIGTIGGKLSFRDGHGKPPMSCDVAGEGDARPRPCRRCDVASRWKPLKCYEPGEEKIALGSFGIGG